MRCAVILVLTLCPTTLALACDAGNRQEVKGKDHVLQNPGKAGGRDGGETIVTAVFIPAIPTWRRAHL